MSMLPTLCFNHIKEIEIFFDSILKQFKKKFLPLQNHK